MIDCYCKVCGLFISIPDEYAGGSGACPRCRTQLRIPRPIGKDNPDYVPGQRYLAQPLSNTSSDDAPAIITPDMGPSIKFRCTGCGQFFESLQASPYEPAKCPACGKNGEQVGQPTEFPRYLATQADTPQQEEIPKKSDDTVDGYLILQPVEADEMDVVIEGIPVDENGNEINVSLASETASQDIAPEEPCVDELTPQQDSQPSDNNITSPKRVSHPLSRSRSQAQAEKTIPNIKDVPEGHWVYFLKGKVVGPLATQVIKDMLLRGEISQSVLVWKPGLDGWQSADAFDELKVEQQNFDPGEISFRDDASSAAIKILSSRLQFLLWLAVILWTVVILMFLTRKTLEGLGIQAYFTCVIVLLSFSLAGLGFGAMLIIKHIRSFIKSAKKSFAEWLVAMVAFSCAIAVSFSVYTHFEPTPLFENVEHYQDISREGFDYLYAGDFNKTLNRVNWDEFIFNGRNVGKEFKATHSQKQRMLIIAEVMDQLHEQTAVAPAVATQPATQPDSQPAATQPTSQPATPATHPADIYPIVLNWTVIKQTAGDTEVMGKSRNGRRITVNIRGGMITGITIK